MKYALLYIALLFATGIAFSQNAPDDSAKYKTKEIKVTSNRLETDIFSSPNSIKLLSKEYISNVNGERFSDILQTAGGVFLKSYGNASLQTVSINGLGAEHTIILLNGSKLNSFQNSQYDLSLIPKDIISKIEILYNGASSVYGSEAIGGVINVITKEENYDKFITAGTGYGSYGQKSFFVKLKNNINQLSFDLSFNNESSKNNYDYLFSSGNTDIIKHRDNASFDFNNFDFNLFYKFNESTSLSYFSNYVTQDRNLPGIETGSEVLHSNQKDFDWNNSFHLNHSFGKNLLLKSYFNFQNNLTNYVDEGLINSFYKNLVYSNLSQLNYLSKNIDFTTGYDVSYATLNGNDFENTVKRVQSAVFFASDLKFIRPLSIYPSARFENISDINKNILSGKLGINYKPFEKINLNFRTSVSNNFRSPAFNDLYWINSGNINLKPESSYNYDAGAIFNYIYPVNFTVEAKYTKIFVNDKIVWKPANNALWYPLNIDKSESDIFSVDVDVTKNISKDLIFNLDYDYNYASSLKKSSDYPGDLSYNKQIFYIPKETSKINAGLKYKNTGLNLFYSFTGIRYQDLENTIALPAVDLLNGNIYYDLNIHNLIIHTKFEVNNILNKNYVIISGYPMPLRNFKISISLKY